MQFMVGRRTHFTFFEAAACGLLEPLRQYVRQDAGVVNTFAPDGFTALGLAAYFSREDVVRFLLEHGADAKLAANNGSRVAPIHSAVAARDLSIAQRLLDHGADVNAQQHGGYTALHSAGLHGDLAMAELLLSYGADRSLKSEEGKTAYDMAKEKEHAALLGLLLPEMG
jgi:ankyrin repeat protein